ncbi:MAG: hypothetical protein DMG48_03850 [Acidobacteria bacterium]|nr:MAG: hypothetical protein DMG48_03850 [Acidobacteriota bacterium]
MPKLPAVRPREVIRFLEHHGFVLDHASGSHFVYYHPNTKRRAVVPQHNRDFPKGTLLSLLREAGSQGMTSSNFFNEVEVTGKETNHESVMLVFPDLRCSGQTKIRPLKTRA